MSPTWTGDKLRWAVSGCAAIAATLVLTPSYNNAVNGATTLNVAGGMSGFTHFDQAGNATMVDVSAKPATDRTATARARVVMEPATLAMIMAGSAKKGDVLGVARLAGIMGAKRTADLIPLCHPIALTDLQVSITPDRSAGVLRIRAEAATTGQTGVEMEAMTAASVAALALDPVRVLAMARASRAAAPLYSRDHLANAMLEVLQGCVTGNAANVLHGSFGTAASVDPARSAA